MKKPNKIPDGFEWDPKHKELVDVRCNNPKLKKLAKESVPAMCMSPFYPTHDTGPLMKTIKVKRKKEIPWHRYEHIPILTTNARLRRSLLGLRLQWTLKEDGENVTIWKRKKKYCKSCEEIVISSHNQEIASQDIQARVRKNCLQDYEKILALIEANPTFRVVAEECAKGASVTGIKKYPRDILYVIDIFDESINNYLPYTQVYQYCYHYHIPVVTLFATTRHRTLKDLNKFASFVLATCNAEKDYGKDEGMVAKTFNEKHRCKDCGKEW